MCPYDTTMTLKKRLFMAWRDLNRRKYQFDKREDPKTGLKKSTSDIVKALISRPQIYHY